MVPQPLENAQYRRGNGAPAARVVRAAPFQPARVPLSLSRQGSGMLRQFSSDGVHIAYIDMPPEGLDRGEPILLIHGFASNHRINWVNPQLGRDADEGGPAGGRLRQPRPRESEKLYAPHDYRADLMARDAANLLDASRDRAAPT